MKKLLFVLLLIPVLCYAQLPIDQVRSSDVKVNSYVYGALLQPAQPSTTLVILVPGQGATDRNGNQQMMRNDALKKLAVGLADRGIASFRYDKRVLTLLKKNALQENKLRFQDFVDDAASVITYFQNKNRFSKIYVLGHGQGSLVAMLAAQKKPIDGFISLCGDGQSIDKTLLSQISLQMPDLKESASASFKELKEKGKVKDYNPALASIFRKESQPFMSSWMQFNPRREIRKLRVPTLVVGGSKDLQVSPKEAEILHKAKPDSEILVIENMNHVFVALEGDDLENAKSYNESGRKVMPELLDGIAIFVKK